MGAAFKTIFKFALVFFVMTVVNTLAWEHFAGDLYDCTDATLPGYLEPGHWVDAFNGHAVAVVPKIVHGRSMSEADTIKTGWSKGRLLGLWFGFFGFHVLLSVVLACMRWFPRTEPNQPLRATGAALFIAGFLLPSYIGAAQTSVTTRAESQGPVRFPMTGIDSADLEPTFQELEKLLPVEASVFYVGFQNPDSALVTAQIGVSLRDFDFRRLNGAWKKSEEREAKPANNPGGGGIALAELEKALSDNKGALPTKSIIEITVWGQRGFAVWAGIRYGPRAGSGTLFDFNKVKGKWSRVGGLVSWQS